MFDESSKRTYQKDVNKVWSPLMATWAFFSVLNFMRRIQVVDKMSKAKSNSINN